MIKRYLSRRDNPWEVLAVASLTFFGSLMLLLQKGPFVQISAAGRARVKAVAFPASVAHVAGIVVFVFSLLLFMLYFYALRTAPRSLRKR
jgi:hypothetical protein